MLVMLEGALWGAAVRVVRALERACWRRCRMLLQGAAVRVLLVLWSLALQGAAALEGCPRFFCYLESLPA